MNKRNFTLIEMVVAMAVMVVVAMIIGTASATFYNAYYIVGQNHFTFFHYFKIVNYEIIFVRSKGAKAQHTWAYVSIYAASKVQKEPIRTIFKQRRYGIKR